MSLQVMFLVARQPARLTLVLAYLEVHAFHVRAHLVPRGEQLAAHSAQSGVVGGGCAV